MKDKGDMQGDETVNEQSSGLGDADFNAAVKEVANEDGSVDKLKEELVKLRTESEENKDKYLRSLAELENHKKRTMKEHSELIKYQGERVFFDMLEIMDNLELALQHSSSDKDKFISGVELIQKRFAEILNKWEVKQESAVGKDFDPTKHSAISKIRTPDGKPGTVVSELKKAYFYKDKLLRVGEVIVNEGAEPAPTLQPLDTEVIERKEENSDI
jgi:molecular chaperone GrpE